MTPEQVRQHWKEVTERIVPALEYAEEQSPEDYETIVNTIVLPEIFGEGTKVTLANIAGMGGMVDGGNISSLIGRNFDPSTPFGQIKYLHRHPIDEFGNIVVPVVFQRVDGEASSNFLVPLASEYSSIDLSTPKKAYSPRNFFGGESGAPHLADALYRSVADTSSKVAAEYAPVVEPDIHFDSDFAAGKVRAISDLGRARILGCLTSDFEEQFRMVNPYGYFHSFPVDASDGLMHPDLNGTVSFYATQDGSLLGGRSFSAFYSANGYPDGHGNIVFREGQFFRQVVNHEMMHHVLYSHPHEDAVIRAESADLAGKMNDPFGPSILNYNSVINPKAVVDLDAVESYEIRPLDRVIISLNRFCSKDAIEHNVTYNKYDDFRGKVEDFFKVDPDAFRAVTTPMKRVAVSSLRNFAMVEAPITIVETALERMAKSNPDSKFAKAFTPSGISSIKDLMRPLLCCLNFGLGSGLVISAMEGGASFLAGQTFQDAMKKCSSRAGFDQSVVYKKLDEGYKAMQRLPQPVKQFAKQFLIAFASCAVGEAMGQRSIVHSGLMYSAAYNAVESLCSSIMTGLFSGAFRHLLRKVTGLDSSAASAATGHDDDSVIEVEEGRAPPVEGVRRPTSPDSLPLKESETRLFEVARRGAASRPKDDGDMEVVELDKSDEVRQPDAAMSAIFGSASAFSAGQGVGGDFSAKQDDDVLAPRSVQIPRGTRLLVRERKPEGSSFR